MLDVRFFHSPKIAKLANRQKLGWISLLCEAKQQDREGVFANRPVLHLAAGLFKDCIPAWLDAGLLHFSPALCDRCRDLFQDVPTDGAVVHDWYDYQEESRWTKWRRTKDAPPVAPSDATPSAPSDAPDLHHRTLRARASVSVSSSSSSSTEGGPGETTDPAVVYAGLAGWPSKGALDWLDQLTETYGAAAVIRAIGQAKAPRGKLIGAVQDVLRAEARELGKRERDLEKAKVSQRRLDGMVARRMEYFQSTGKWPAEWGERPAA